MIVQSKTIFVLCDRFLSLWSNNLLTLVVLSLSLIPKLTSSRGSCASKLGDFLSMGNTPYLWSAFSWASIIADLTTLSSMTNDVSWFKKSFKTLLCLSIYKFGWCLCFNIPIYDEHFLCQIAGFPSLIFVIFRNLNGNQVRRIKQGFCNLTSVGYGHS